MTNPYESPSAATESTQRLPLFGLAIAFVIAFPLATVLAFAFITKEPDKISGSSYFAVSSMLVALIAIRSKIVRFVLGSLSLMMGTIVGIGISAVFDWRIDLANIWIISGVAGYLLTGLVLLVPFAKSFLKARARN